ncbi:hypothetical protein Btru_059635 [Bulinus truncatus]|nr:hypothetical protein Btru_059635 [Bulinus truncatus]
MEEQETELPYTDVEISPEPMTPTPKAKKLGSKIKPKGLVVTTSMILFTPEDREIRKQKRLEKSQCCTGECWKTYKAKISSDSSPQVQIYPKQECEKEDIFCLKNSMGILFDPLVERRRRFLNRKFKDLLDTFSMMHESGLPPYIRPLKRRRWKEWGRRGGQISPNVSSGKNGEGDVDRYRLMYRGERMGKERWTDIA